jgi:hypothetical protein
MTKTAWLSLTPTAALFKRDKSVISLIFKNVFDEGELGPGQLLQNLQRFNVKVHARLGARSAES